MKNIKNIYSWAKRYNLFSIYNLILLLLLNLLFSWIPILISYGIKLISNSPLNDVNLPYFLRYLIEKPQSITNSLLVIAIFIFVTQLIRSFMRFSSTYTQSKIQENISRDMKVKMYNHISDLSYSYQNKADTGDLIQRCTSDINTASRFVAMQVPSLFGLIVTILIGAYQIFKISPTLMIISCIAIPITGIASILYFLNISKVFEKVEKAESEMTTVIQENVNLARVVRSFGNEKYEFDKMDQYSKKYKDHSIHAAKVMGLFWSGLDALVGIQYAAVVLVSIYLVRSNRIDAADVIATLLLVGMLIWPIRGLGRIISELGKTIVSTNRLQEIIDEKSEFEINGKLTPVINGDIKFQNVTFNFEDDKNSLLKGLTFDIKKGETVVILGKTGSGKSTVCNLLTRMLEVSSGDILLSGVNIKDIEKHYLRKNVKMILQDPFLFSKTVYENITIQDKHASKHDVYEAARIASIDNEIESFQDGYETIVGEKGTTLSGGQKQRVAIARTLLKESPILIFDDSLSALDNNTDMMIRNTLKQKSKNQTLIIITHRTSTIKDADKIIILENGVIKSIGTHESLVTSSELYQEIWKIQGNLEEDFNKIMAGEVNE